MSNVNAADHEHHQMGHDHSRADSHAPIGVMGDHVHPKGKLMFSYRFMNMHMQGMMDGSDNISADEVALSNNALAGETMRMGYMPDGSPRLMTVPATYRIVPRKMDMRMHMFGAMYGLTENVTLMAMLNYVEKEMTLRTYQGMAGTNVAGTFTGRTSGIGDTKISALVRLFEESGHKFHMSLGLSLPTGSIDEKGSVLPPFAGMMTPAGQKVSIDRLAYPMQLGSGSYDLLPGITYSSRQGDLSWGSQLSATIRLNDNKEDYRLGDKVEITGWVAKQWAPWISSSVRLSYHSEGQIRGRDEVITGGMPLFDPENSGRDQVDLNLGVNLLGQKGMVKGHRLDLEVGVPLYQEVNGLQMKNDWAATIGWRKTF